MFWDQTAEDEVWTRQFLKPISLPAAMVDRLRRKVLIRQSVAGYCESPIELDLAVFLIERFGFSGDLKFKFCRQADIWAFQDQQILLIPQFRWLRFRIDFAFMFEAKVPHVFVECDGKEFHSTPEQIANDRRKDSLARGAGIRLLRFTGSEIYRGGQEIGTRVGDAIMEQVAAS